MSDDDRLVADCLECWYTAFWDREPGDPEVHPHAGREGHSLEYEAAGDRLGGPLDHVDLAGGAP